MLDKVGVEPQVQRYGKYKSAGDQLLRSDMSEAQREQLQVQRGCACARVCECVCVCAVCVFEQIQTRI